MLRARPQPRAGDLRRSCVSALRTRAFALVWVAAVVLTSACKHDGATASSVPEAEAYDAPSDFAGTWIGEVEGQVGTLTISSLGPGRYRGRYEGEAVAVDYVLLLEQDLMPLGAGLLPGNRALFTWQDGRGGRGEGWLLINREDSALTGAFGERGLLERPWSFIRVE